MAPAAALGVADAGLTLAGQPGVYWAGEYGAADEANPLARLLLCRGPWLFAAVAGCWLAVVSVVIVRWSHPLSGWLAVGIAVAHAIGGGSWLVKAGPWGLASQSGSLPPCGGGLGWGGGRAWPPDHETPPVNLFLTPHPNPPPQRGEGTKPPKGRAVEVVSQSGPLPPCGGGLGWGVGKAWLAGQDTPPVNLGLTPHPHPQRGEGTKPPKCDTTPWGVLAAGLYLGAAAQGSVWCWRRYRWRAATAGTAQR